MARTPTRPTGKRNTRRERQESRLTAVARELRSGRAASGTLGGLSPPLARAGCTLGTCVGSAAAAFHARGRLFARRAIFPGDRRRSSAPRERSTRPSRDTDFPCQGAPRVSSLDGRRAPASACQHKPAIHRRTTAFHAKERRVALSQPPAQCSYARRAQLIRTRRQSAAPASKRERLGAPVVVRTRTERLTFRRGLEEGRRPGRPRQSSPRRGSPGDAVLRCRRRRRRRSWAPGRRRGWRWWSSPR
jgi:hypothetical protein